MRSRILVAAVVVVALSLSGCALFSGSKKSEEKAKPTAAEKETKAAEKAAPAKAAEKPVAPKPAAPVKAAEKPVEKAGEKAVEKPAEKAAKPAKPPKPPKPVPTILSLTVNVRGAEVVLDGAVIGNVSSANKAQKFEVKPGTHELVVRKFCYEEYKATLGVENGIVNTHKVELKRLPAIDVSKELQAEKAAERQ